MIRQAHPKGFHVSKLIPAASDEALLEIHKRLQARWDEVPGPLQEVAKVTQTAVHQELFSRGVFSPVFSVGSEDVSFCPIEKKEDEDRQIIFGIVLEPDDVDAHGDTISAAEIEKAAHLWLARFQDRGLMHKEIINSRLEIYESYVTKQDQKIGGQNVKKGTWVLMLHVLDPSLWKQIKDGELTGFSMGGFARRVET